MVFRDSSQVNKFPFLRAGLPGANLVWWSAVLRP